MHLPASWNELEEQTQQDYFRELVAFLREERRQYQVFPDEALVYAALEATALEDVKLLLLGQDPYHREGQAHGLCFSVQRGVKIPPSLRNIYKELTADVGCATPNHGHLMSWAQQGVLMLNTVLTVRANEPNSHRKKGWETFTDAVIRRVNQKQGRVAFVLWGNSAQEKKSFIDESRHAIIESVHPSPLSARRGFFGSRPFSKINEVLRQSGQCEIDWRLPE